MRLYNSSSCTPVVMKARPSKWRSPHHFLPLLDTVPTKSAKLGRDGVFRRVKGNQKISRFQPPEVIKSSTSTTASTSPERTKANGSNASSCAEDADDTLSFSDLHQRSSYEMFHFDLDTNQREDGDQHLRFERSTSSSSTVSTKSLNANENVDLLSFEDFTVDGFEDAQPTQADSEASPFIICQPKERKVVSEDEIDRGLFLSSSTDHTFPPIERPTQPPQVPLNVASPVAVVEKSRRDLPLEMDNSLPLGGKSITATSAKVSVQGRGDLDPSSDLVDDDEMELLKASPRRDKYLKMLKVGLPMGAIRIEMSKDGVSPTKKHLPDQGSKCDVQHFRIHWDNFHPVSKPSAPSLWSHIKLDDEWLGELKIDPAEMKTLFERENTKKTASGHPPKSQSVLRVIEPKRASNCAIFLASLSLTCHEIAVAIDSLNHEVFNLDQINDLLKFLPTDKEADVLKSNIKANPHCQRLEGEKYMVEMIKVEDARTKLDIMATMKRFPSVCNAVIKDAMILKEVCEEIILSSGLHKTIGLILHLGNLVNTSGGKDAVSAVRMSCLLKLSQTRSFDAKTSFLDYAARVAWKNGSSIDLPSGVDHAAKLDWANTVEEFEKLDAKLPQIRNYALRDSSVFLEDDEELIILESTATGRFALDGYRKAASVYAEMQDVHTSFRRLCDYFGESSADPKTLIKELATFCNQFQCSFEKAKKNTVKACSLPTILETSSSFGSI